MKQLLVLVACALVAACGAGPSFSARVISTINTVGTGEQRVLVELRSGDGELLALDPTPNITVRDENGSPLGVYPGELVWVVPDTQPAYAFVVQIPVAETYQLTVDGGELGETPPAGLIAVEDPIQVVVGEPAPPIAGDSVTGPMVVVFASPEQCQSQSCQPMIDQVASAVEGTPVGRRVVEVFTNPEVEDVSELDLSTEVEDWGLPSQPWLYAIDDSGTVAALYEGAVSEDELRNAVELISG